ncbi:hypothetical protein F5X68DRAFT_189774 [Plectosphaerella plurivora]|uniref:DNA replication checkpoint mediator MRC1 domain-containing protein n=1 Tax=Plectosphaerella plurivora TaxID=936078 RepID=A0A9P9AD08_9PEZI|nr:hypothetical protein F5X68DRAFT_189774 [Plectosphaerella plurivora]
MRLSYILSLGLAALVTAACNGHDQYCGKKFSEITMVGSHNSAFVGRGPSHNQYVSVTKQLDMGMCHSHCLLLDVGPLEDYLEEVGNWVDRHPDEVVTLLLTNNDGLPLSKFDEAFKDTGVDEYAFRPGKRLAKEEWPTLQELINSGRRLVVFLDSGANINSVDYILPQWDYYWETPFGETNPSFPNCNMDRPDNGNPNQLMMMINHFLNIEIPFVKIKIPDQIRAQRTNSFESINAQAELCKAQWGKTTNVILLDWVDVGDAMRTQRHINKCPSPGSSPEPELLLSPKSRLEARLAAMDTSSEDEDEQPLPALRRKRSPPPTTTQNDDATADSEEDIRPRGRLAARMQGGSPTARAASQTSQVTNTDDEDLPVLPRRLKQKPARDSASPQPRSPIARSSSALFVSSPPPAHTQQADASGDSNSEEEFPALKSDRFKALVERKRQERLAREAEEERKREERLARQAELDAQILEDDDDNDSSITDDEGGRKLTQGARPTRKAGKKAIEEMNRETQRMARNMQLAHEAKTRKKITKASLFERFNFKTAGAAAQEANPASSSRQTSPVSVHSDVEMGDAATPPSSPPTDKTPKVPAAAEIELDIDDVLLAATQPKVDKGKGKAIDSPQKPTVTEAKPKRQFRVKLPQVPVNLVSLDPDDDELQVVMTRKERLDAIFDSVHDKKPQVAPVSKKPKRKGEVQTMTASELSFSLMQRAREQAKAAREQRLEMLRSKGIFIQTEEEREKEMQSVDDIVTRARKEAEEIMDRERDAAKQDRKDKIKNGELDPLAWDDSDDEEYEGSDEGQEAADQDDVELSGSEEEDEADADSDGEGAPLGLVDDQASEEDGDEQDDEDELPTMNPRRAKKNVHVISSDEDSDSDIDIIKATPRPKALAAISPAAPNTKSPAVPTSVLRSARKTFIPGLPVAGAAGLGLTQIFAGTMDDSQAGPLGGTMQSPMPTLGSFPDFGNMSQDDTQLEVDRIPDSQANIQQNETQAGETQGVQLHFTQSQMHGFDSLLRDDDDMTGTQLSFEASQDAGLAEYTPLKRRFVEPSPFMAPPATPALGGDSDVIMDSPLVRRGRLRQKIASITEEADEPTVIASTFDEEPISAFNVMAKAARKEKKRKEFLKKKSKAKGMFEEQAEESEDEYAGLGGADGEDSSDDDAASVKEMIDDAAGNPDDERKIAALYANGERERDVKMVDKLFHDITTGALRRKRGADYNLSDSDDGGEARRKMKRRQHAKMTKALLADDRVKKIAEKPGNEAFLRTLEDRESDEEMDFLDMGLEPPEEESQSQSQSQDQAVPTQPTATRAPAHLRRTKNGKKPSNISEIRESVSSLLEDPNALNAPVVELISDDEQEDENRPSTSSSNKENPRRTKAAVIDRMSLRRQSSSNLSASSRLAFAMPTATGSTGFKVPALLRRATTNSLASAASSSTTTSTTSGGFGDSGRIKKSAGKMSGVSALARETERRAQLQQNDKKREAKKWKVRCLHVMELPLPPSFTRLHPTHYLNPRHLSNDTHCPDQASIISGQTDQKNRRGGNVQHQPAMTPGAPPSTPDPRRFLPSRRAVAGSQQETTPGPRQFQPSGGFVGSSSQRFQATPRFAPPSSATTPRPTPSTQAFLLPGSVRSTQRREREQIDDVPSSSPAGFTSPVPANKGPAGTRESIEAESETDGLEESQSVIADSAGEYEGDGDGDGPAPKRRRTRPLSDLSEEDREETMVDFVDDGQEEDLIGPEPLDDELIMSDLDEEMHLSDHERRGKPEQQPKFHAAPRFKLPESEETPNDGLPEAFSPQRRGAKYVHGGMAAEMQSWLADVRGWTGHERPPDAVMRVVIDEVRPGNAMYLVRGRRLLRDEAVADPGAAGLRIMLAGDGKSTGLARRAAVNVGGVVVVSQPVWEVPLKGDGRWIVACEWAVEAG